MVLLVENSLKELSQLEERHNQNLANLLEAAYDSLLLSAQQTQRVPRLPQKARAALVEGLTSLWQDTTESSASLMIAAFEEGFPRLLKNNALSPEAVRIVTAYIDGFGAERATQIIRTTEKQAENLILGGLRRGQSLDIVYASIVNRIPDLAETRAALITRTETHALSQFTSQKMAMQSNVLLKKTWNSVQDERTRTFNLFDRMDMFDHKIMNGVSIGLQDQFRVPTRTGNFEHLQFPGDPSGSAGNTINCRCIQTYVRVD